MEKKVGNKKTWLYLILCISKWRIRVGYIFPALIDECNARMKYVHGAEGSRERSVSDSSLCGSRKGYIFGKSLPAHKIPWQFKNKPGKCRSTQILLSFHHFLQDLSLLKSEPTTHPPFLFLLLARNNKCPQFFPRTCFYHYITLV